MIQSILEYLSPSNEERKKIWDNCTFVFDTDVLLNLYRYSINARVSLMDALNGLNNVWIPYQVVLEFMRRRPEVIFETVNRYDKLQESCNTYTDEIAKQLRLTSNDKSIEALLEFNKQWIAEKKKSDLIVTHPDNDSILEDLMSIFKTGTGKPYSKEVMDEIYAEGEFRYSRNIPPGYKTENLDVNGCIYGDYILWRQIIDYSKMNSTDIIFVTYDKKDDWWQVVNGKTIGPRVELKKEFHRKTLQNFLLYNMNSFMAAVNANNTNTVSEETINEVEQVQLEADISIDKIHESIDTIHDRIDSIQEKLLSRYDSLNVGNNLDYEKSPTMLLEDKKRLATPRELMSDVSVTISNVEDFSDNKLDKVEDIRTYRDKEYNNFASYRIKLNSLHNNEESLYLIRKNIDYLKKSLPIVDFSLSHYNKSKYLIVLIIRKSLDRSIIDNLIVSAFGSAKDFSNIEIVYKGDINVDLQDYVTNASQN